MQTKKFDTHAFGAHPDDGEYAAYTEGFTTSGYIGVNHFYQLT